MTKTAKRKAKTPAKSAIVILGMHRSGTSALAGILNMLGCDLPSTLMPANAYNEKGYFESDAIRHLNDACLKSAGSAWNDWLTLNSGWYDSPKFETFRARCEEMLASEFGDSPLYVLKDPRLCRLMPLWGPVLKDAGVTPAYVLTHRNPLDVAASLKARDNMPEELSVLIWLRHVLEAEVNTRGKKRVFTSFDQVMDNWAGTVRKLEDGLALHFPHDLLSASEQVEEFLSGKLRHHAHSKAKVLQNPLIAEWVQTVFGILETWVETGETAADRKEFDRVRAEFDTAAPVFAKLVGAGTAARKTAQELSSHVQELEKAEAESQKRLAEAQTRQTELTETRARLEARVREISDEAARAASESTAQITEKQSEIKSLSEKRTALETRVRKVTDDAARAAAESSAQISQKQSEITSLSEKQVALEARFVEVSKSEKDAKRQAEEQTAQAAAQLAKLEQMRATQASSEAQMSQLSDALKKAQEHAAAQEALAAEQAAELVQLQDQLNQVQSALRQRQHEAEEVGKENADLKQHQTDLEEQLAAALASAEEAGAQLAQKGLELQRAREEIAEVEARAETQSTELVTLTRFHLENEQKLKDLEAKHAADVERLQQAHQKERDQQLERLAEKSKEFGVLDDRSKAQLQEMTELSRMLATSENQVAKLEEDLTARKKQAERMVAQERKRAAREMQAQRERSVDTLKREAARAAKELQDLETVLQQKQELQEQYFQSQLEKAELEKQQLERQAQRDQEKLLLERKHAEDREATRMIQLEAEQNRVAVAGVREQELLAQLEAERQRADEAEQNVAALRNSTSWRLMAPVRGVVSVFRR